MDTLVLVFVCVAAALVPPWHLQLVLEKLQSAGCRTERAANESGTLTILPLQLAAPYSMGICSDGTLDLFFNSQQDKPQD